MKNKSYRAIRTNSSKI